MSQLFLTNLLLHIGTASLQSFIQISILWALVLYIQRKKERTATSAPTFNALVFTQLVSVFICIISFIKPIKIEVSAAENIAFLQPITTLSNNIFSSLITIAGLAYCVLAFYKIIQFFAKYKAVNKVVSPTKIESYYSQFVRQSAKQLQVYRNITISFTDAVIVPCTLHIFRPLILLPIAASTQLTSKQIELIILHELAHIKRNDYAINLLLQFSFAVIWFNPFNARIKNTLDQLREMSCDELVLQQNEEPILYAETLLQLAKVTVKHNQFPIALTGNRASNLFSKRIESILIYQKYHSLKANLLFPITLFAFLCFAIGFVSVKFNTKITEKATIAHRASNSKSNSAVEKIVVKNSDEIFVKTKRPTKKQNENKLSIPTSSELVSTESGDMPYQFVNNSNPEIATISPAIFQETVHEINPEKTFIQIKHPANKLDSNSKQLNVIFELQKRVLKRAKI